MPDENMGFPASMLALTTRLSRRAFSLTAPLRITVGLWQSAKAEASRDLSSPDKVEPPMRNPRFAKSWFLADLSLCEQYLSQLGLVVVCDFSVRTLILDRIAYHGHRPEVVTHAAVLDRVPIKRETSLVPIVQERDDVVWISCGTPFGPPLFFEAVQSRIPERRIVGVVGASAFNDGYAGLFLHSWWERRLEDPIIGFYGGRVIQGSSDGKVLRNRGGR
jgi:hypothetical protein